MRETTTDGRDSKPGDVEWPPPPPAGKSVSVITSELTESRRQSLWVAFACAGLQSGDSATTASHTADQMLAEMDRRATTPEKPKFGLAAG